MKNLLHPLLIICLLLTGNNYAQQTSKNVVLPSIVNPVFDVDFPDPTVINFNDTFYAYATQASLNSQTFNIQVASSTDLISWKHRGDALPVKPEWANSTQDFWAPHVLYDPAIRKFVMFYSGEAVDTSLDKCIGVAYADKPTGPFIDKGSPLLIGKGFSEIDPMGFVDPQTGKKLLYWGSGFQPIRLREMTNDWSAFKEGSETTAVVFPGKEKNYTRLIEGAWLDVNDGMYYLYYSGDNCCGEHANYAVLISRATNAFGPFVSLGEANATGKSVILEKDSTWIAPGHNSIIKDNKGQKWIAYHAIRNDKNKPGSTAGNTNDKKRVMCIKPIEYINGWPVVIN